MPTIATWPSALPGWHVEGYSYKPGDPNARTDMDAGNARIRRRFISTWSSVTLQTVLTQAQLGQFEAWWVNETFEGSAPMLMPITNGAGTSNVRCQSTSDMYSPQPIGAGLWRVSMSVKALNLPVSNG